MSQGTGRGSVPGKPRGQRGTRPSRRAAVLDAEPRATGARKRRDGDLEESVRDEEVFTVESRSTKPSRKSRRRGEEATPSEPPQVEVEEGSSEPESVDLSETAEPAEAGASEAPARKSRKKARRKRGGAKVEEATEVGEEVEPEPESPPESAPGSVAAEEEEPVPAEPPRRGKSKGKGKSKNKRKRDEKTDGEAESAEELGESVELADPAAAEDVLPEGLDPAEVEGDGESIVEGETEVVGEPADEESSEVGLDPEEDRRKMLAVLFGSPEELTVHRLSEILGWPRKDVEPVLADVQAWVDEMKMPFEVRNIAGGWRLATRTAYAALLGKLRVVRRRDRLSGAALETLSIVAYKQPIVASEVDRIRGVKCGPILKTLQERGFVHVTGRAESAGRPLLYGTTKLFLDRFGLASLEDLPTMEDLRARRDD